MTFGSTSLTAHLGRGAIGAAALVAALKGYDVVGAPALLGLGVTLWMFRGCPMCWTIGLLETVAMKVLRGREAG